MASPLKGLKVQMASPFKGLNGFAAKGFKGSNGFAVQGFKVQMASPLKGSKVQMALPFKGSKFKWLRRSKVRNRGNGKFIFKCSVFFLNMEHLNPEQYSFILLSHLHVIQTELHKNLFDENLIQPDYFPGNCCFSFRPAYC